MVRAKDVKVMADDLALRFQFEYAEKGQEGYTYLIAPLRALFRELGKEEKTDSIRWVIRYSPSGRVAMFNTTDEFYAFLYGSLVTLGELDGAKPFLATFDGVVVTSEDNDEFDD